MSKKKELNKKKIIICAVIVVMIIAIIICTVIFLKNKANKEDSIEEQVSKGVQDTIGLTTFEIKSTKSKPIEKDGIEATNISFVATGDQLEVKTTLKNNNKEDLNGYMIEINFLDDAGNIITTIADNSPDVIKSKESKEILNYVIGLENPEAIKRAEISSLEASSMGKSLEKTFDEMIPDLDEMEAQQVQAPEGTVQQGPEIPEETITDEQ